MKKFQLSALIAFTLFSFAFILVFAQKAAPDIEKIEKTQLFSISVKECKNGGINKYFRLIDSHNKIVVDWVKDKQGNNPFVHCRGLVFMGNAPEEMELIDCRSTPYKPILSLQYLRKHGYVLEDMRPHYNDTNTVVIELRQKNVAGFLGKHLMSYNLQTKELTSLLN